LYGREKATLQGASATVDRFVRWVHRCKSHFPINRNRAPVRVGGCEPEHGDLRRVAEHWAGLGKSRRSTGQATAAVRAGHGYTARLRGASATCRAVCWAGQHEQKIMPDYEYYTTRQGSLRSHVFLSGPRLPQRKRFFSSSGAATIPHIFNSPQMVDRFLGAPRIHAC